MRTNSNLDEALEHAPQRACMRGQEYFDGGHVSDLSLSKGMIIATVEGENLYTVKMSV